MQSEATSREFTCLDRKLLPQFYKFSVKMVSEIFGRLYHSFRSSVLLWFCSEQAQMKLVLSHDCIESSSKLRWNCFVLGALFDHFLEA